MYLILVWWEQDVTIDVPSIQGGPTNMARDEMEDHSIDHNLTNIQNGRYTTRIYYSNYASLQFFKLAKA